MDRRYLVGIEINWEGYRKAQKDRWKPIGGGILHCELHNTYFTDDSRDKETGKPCWKCLSEFQMRILNEL